MAKTRWYRVPTNITWAASGAISQELSPIPFSISGMYLQTRLNVTTTSATNFNDYWDRVIASLSLTGQVYGQNKSFISFSEMRLPYHLMRRELAQYCPRRPTVIPNSTTSGLYQFGTLIHFGAAPFKPNGDFDWRDMSAGIPPTAKGQLTIGGTFGSATAMGTSVTINSGNVVVWLYGPQQEAGDAITDYVPRAWPVWSMTSPTPTATSTMFGTPYNVTSGGWLRSMAFMTTRGSNTPRDNQVLRDIRLYSQLENRPIIEFGGQGAAGDASGGDYAIAEQFTQLGQIWPTDDTLTNGVPSFASAQGSDVGLFYFRMVDYSNKVHPLYGADLRHIATGDLRIDQGVNNVTTIAEDVLYQRYELNPENPLNAGLV